MIISCRPLDKRFATSYVRAHDHLPEFQTFNRAKGQKRIVVMHPTTAFADLSAGMNVAP